LPPRTVLLAAGLATAAPPKVVTAPNSDAQCFAPWAANTKLFQYPAKKGPYRIALANGYIANTWRIQMIKTAKAYAAQPEVAAKLKEFKVVSTGEDVAAQIAAINNFIDSGYDAIVVNAQNPAAFKPVIKRANDAVSCWWRSTTYWTPKRRSTSTSTRRGSASIGRMAGEERAERRQGTGGARRVRHVGRSRPA
jgi:ABC-type sugar transport system substrate-binding protein